MSEVPLQVSGLKSLLAAAEEGMAAWEDDDMSDEI